MHKLSLKERLIRWLKQQPGWIHSGELQRIVSQKTSYTPQNVGRRLRELENEGVLEVKYEKGTALYRYNFYGKSLADSEEAKKEMRDENIKFNKLIEERFKDYFDSLPEKR